MTTHEDRIRSYFAACSSGSKDEVARPFTEDAVIYDPTHAPIVSAENIGNFWVQIHATCIPEIRKYMFCLASRRFWILISSW